MKTPRQARDQRLQSNAAVRAEMRIFREAMLSYPDRFAADPKITFEEHCTRLTTSAKAPLPLTKARAAGN